MSETGQNENSLLQINANASQIVRSMLRDVVTSVSVLARPVGITACGLGLGFTGFMIGLRAYTHGLTEWDCFGLSIVAAGFGVAAWMRTKDKGAVTGALSGVV